MGACMSKTCSRTPAGAAQAPVVSNISNAVIRIDVGAPTSSNERHVLCVSIPQLRHLMTADTTIAGRSSDPFVVVRVELADGSFTQSQQTRVIFRSVNPVFNERFDFDCGLSAPRRLLITVSDFDRGTANDALGDAEVEITPAAYEVNCPFVWVPLKSAKSGEIQLQIAAKKYNVEDEASALKLDYVHSVGLVTLRINSLENFVPGPLAVKALGKNAFESGNYDLRCVLQHGLRHFNSRVVKGGSIIPRVTNEAPSSSAISFTFEQDCRMWIRDGQQQYIMRVILLATTAANPLKPVLLGHGFFPMSILADSMNHFLKVHLCEVALKDRNFTDADQAALLNSPGLGRPGSEEEDIDDGSGFKAPDVVSARENAILKAPSASSLPEALPRTDVKALSTSGKVGLGLNTTASLLGEDTSRVEPESFFGDAAATDTQVGTFHFRALFETKEVVEQWFFGRLMAEFDSDQSGNLDKTEMLAMIHTLGAQMTEVEILSLMQALDADKDGRLSSTELLRWFRSAAFQRTPMAYSLLAFLADGKKGLDELVNDVTRVASSTNRSTNAGAAILSVNEADKVVLADRGLKIYDRKTGLVLTEHIPTFVATAINLMYHSAVGSILTNSVAVRAMLARMSAKEGAKMNKPESRAKIPEFVKQLGIDTSEILRPLDEFEHFNAFFYRELKPSARPVAAPGNDTVVVSPADSRMVVYDTVLEAAKIWIKGASFTIETLLGSACADVAPLFFGGSLCLARLAPQDYHRWHLPVSGKLVRRHPIDGALYTVNPIAIRRNNPDVYTENKREVLLVQTRMFGLVAMVAVGATVVGSINIVLPDGSFQEKGVCHGYFAFGGSTVLVLFQPGAVRFDKDLLGYSRTPLETYVRVGEQIGVAPAPGATFAQQLPETDPDLVAHRLKYSQTV